MSDDLIIDLSNYKDRVGSRVAPGTYRVQVEDAEITKAASGNTMVNIWLTILDGEFQGGTIMDRLVLTENSLFRVVGFMQAINLPTPKQKLKLNVRQFVGRTLDVEVDDGEPYNGRVRSEVRSYMKIAGSAAAAQTLDLEDESDEEPAPAKESKPAETVKSQAPDASEESDDLDLESVDL